MKLLKSNRVAWAAFVFALALPLAVMADLSQSATLTPTQSLNLDTGVIATSGTGADLLWNGITLLPPGTAKVGIIGGISGASAFQSLDQAVIQAFSSQTSQTPIPSASLTQGTILAAFTNGGHASKVLVVSNTSGSLALQFTTFGAAAAGGPPTITNVLNNSSLIPAGFPNSGIAQGSLFQILGTNLANSNDATLHETDPSRGGSPLASTLNGATITVTSGSTVLHPGMYYATPSQIDGVLPAATPLGPATVTVSFNGLTSATFGIQVVAAAPGITVFNGSGVAQHALTGALVTYTASAAPAEVLIFWGTGVGATGNSDTAFDTSAHQTTVPYAFYIGGVAASVAYKGASVYPGVGVFGVTVPANAPTGCFVPVAAVTGSVVSNVVTLPIAAGGGVCSDPQLGYNGTQISTLNGPAGQNSVKSGFLLVSQATAPGSGTTNFASAIFQQTTGFSAGSGGNVSIGSCILSQTASGGSTGTSTGLNAGTVTVSGPGGGPFTLTSIPQAPGVYTASLASIPSTGGAYVFTGTAGSQVGAFTSTISFPNPLLVWTSSATSVTRSQALNVTWTGGVPGSSVTITGSSTGGGVTGSFTCIAPQSAGQFTVPSYILLGLPAGTGTTTVQDSTFTSFTAPSLDFGAALGSVSFSVNSTYN